jgi:polar amino acid transport system ATP-binding protein
LTEKLLVVEDVWKRFGSLEVLKGVSLSLERGEKKVLIGPSGTGKSTLLRCVNRLATPERGRISLGGVDITDPKCRLSVVRQQIGMVFQHFNLFIHMSVLRNVTLGLTDVKRIGKREAAEKAMAVLERVGLADKADAYPAELSGGQQQRAGIARAIAMEPELVLFDEPTSALDPELIGEVLKVMTGLAQDGMTMLLVTHEMGFARAICDEIIFMEHGMIIEQGPPNKVFTCPKHERTRQFLHKITELYGQGGDAE